MAGRVVVGSAATSVVALLLAAAAAAPAHANETPPPGAPPAAVRASALVDWHLAASLAALRAEVNARWPGRDRSSDGAIGDALHQARTNSHNPARHPGGPAVGTQGAVHALDITANGIDVGVLLDAVIGDPRVWYVIHDGRIWSRTTGWAARAHSGDPHSTHVHINLREDTQDAAVAAETDTSRWLGGSGGVGRGSSASGARVSPALAPGLSTSATRALQRALIARGFTIPSGATGWYGPETTKAVRAFQRSQGWTGSGADGIAGQQTLRRLGLTGTTTTQPTSRPRSRPAAPAPSSSSSAASAAYAPGTASREVYFLQQALIDQGYPIPAGATGYFGQRTVDAVAAFQRAQGWPESKCDGIPGPRTLRLLGLS